MSAATSIVIEQKLNLCYHLKNRLDRIRVLGRIKVTFRFEVSAKPYDQAQRRPYNEQAH